MSWKLSRSTFLVEFALVPVYGVMAVWVALYYATPTLGWLGALAGGFASWTLVEYCMHRWLFHGSMLAEHRLHHIRPTDWIGAGPLVTGPAALVAWLACVTASGGVGLGGVLFLGFLTGYYAYILVHLAIHHTTGLIPVLRARHEAHHAGVNGNYGVITTFWDEVFGTVVA